MRNIRLVVRVCSGPGVADADELFVRRLHTHEGDLLRVALLDCRVRHLCRVSICQVDSSEST